jgi:DNA-binding NtrC family response regulator
MSDTGALVYVVDDDPFARDAVADLIRSAGLMTKTFASGEEFLAAGRPQMPSCLLLDVSLPGLSGLDVQKELVKSGAQIPIIFLTGHGDIPMTVRAVKAGAVDFLTKPFDGEDLLNAVRECLTSSGKEIQNESYFEEIVGNSEALRRVLRNAETVAPTDATVLIYGETGTGKELIARAIHDRSPRHARAFVKLNCAAIPTGLLESELFGHEKGAFTGAIAQRIGRFELANGGTIFLDEVGEIPLELQPKLLRVLQEREFERLGSTRTLRTDVRLIAATNRDLAVMVEDGKFRADLFYRLNVFPINVPPLRERPEDIPLLVMHFVQESSRRMNKHIDTIPSGASQALLRYHWPGNIRELQNVIERAVILSRGSILKMPFSELKQPVMSGKAVPSRPDTLEEAERKCILQALEAANWVIAGPRGAAVRLGLKRSTLQFRMGKLGISRTYTVLTP